MQDQWVGWLQANRRHFFYGVLFTIALFFIAFQVYEKFHKPSRGHYLTINRLFEKWLANGEAFDKLELALRTHPDLEAKFGAAIAEKFITQEQGDKAEPFATNVFERIMKHIPEHTAFAEGSLLISKKQYKDALANAISLQARIDENTLLYGFNLIRIASLYRALDLQDQELASLDDLEHYLKTHTDASTILNKCFCEGQINLSDYITQRKIQAKIPR